MRAAAAAIVFSLVPAGLVMSAAGASEPPSDNQAQAATPANHQSAMSIAGAVVGSVGAIGLAVGGSSVAARFMRSVEYR